MERDAVDLLVDQWRTERPDLDVEPMAVIARLGRVTALVTQRVEAALEAHGLKLGEFDVLATLRRSGRPYALTPGALIASLMLSSGAMTNRIDRLESAGLVERLPDPDDRRGVLVRLTPEGRTLIDRAVADHVANEARLLTAVTVRDRDALDRVLRRMLASLSTE